MANSGIAPKEIRSYLLKRHVTLPTQQDLYNCIARGRQQLTQGQSSGKLNAAFYKHSTRPLYV
jgi:hypothetical protein